MPIEIKIGPPQVTIHSDRNAFVSAPDGGVDPRSNGGLFFRDTRLVAKWRLTASGTPWRLLNFANESCQSVRIVLLNREFQSRRGRVPQRTLGLVVSRVLSAGLEESFELTNHGPSEVDFDLELEIASDFADIFEVKSHEAVQRKGVASEWREEEQRLTNSYKRESFARAIRLQIESGEGRAAYANGKIVMPIGLKPGALWRARLTYEFFDGDERYTPPAPDADVARRHRKVARFSSSDTKLDRVGEQALEDIASLHLQMRNRPEKLFPAAGAPWYLTVFGRDILIASLQFQLVDPQLAHGALDILGELQAREVDDFRDAEPGKIPHEMRHGELAHFHEVPQYPYYGSADTTPLYLILLHSTWKRSGERGLIDRHLETAKRCLEWIDAYGDRDGDGFQEYQTRSPKGYENQSWKDSGDAIVYLDGRHVQGPKALCELQGYVFDAWTRMAEIFAFLGEESEADRLRRKAKTLYDRFNEAFWDEETGFYALTLDGDKRKVMSIASNPGHCMWSGIVPKERAKRVVDRLFRPDMWSGWGIRTLSADHCAYNPYAYQRGAIWPHDNSIIALGLKRYGYVDECHRVIRAVCEAAGYFTSSRLPELFAGTDRDSLNFPLRYIGANVPQAWASGAIFAFIQALVGFSPDLPHSKLRLDPSLPDWLPSLSVTDVPLGDRKASMHFQRDEAGRTQVWLEPDDLSPIDVAWAPE